MLDYLLILAYLALLAIFNVFLFPSIQSFFHESLVVAQLTGFLMVTLPVSLYFIICDSVIGGQSFGKRRMGIRVVSGSTCNLSYYPKIFTMGAFALSCLSPNLYRRCRSSVKLLYHWRYYLCTHVCVYSNLHVY